ncbi:hypothetical protein DENSPDRAFT_812014 [Dentipellis sp. KUC8613]|nr:hypothetical protein DENSPDRAFT_812014 [Dentipellis sp. KUC8613]
MASPDTLRTFLQLQLATDAYAVLHLPYVLSVLSAQSLGPSEHLQKWTTRLSSLLYSKDPAARWAGLCLALQTSVLSKALMMENAQGWTAIALPLLSKNEPVPNLKAAIRLLFRIFSAATDVPEFQRQLATPNVPKYGLALLTLADKHADHELKILAIDVLSQLVPLYPTLLRPIHASLSSFCLRQLNGSAAPPTDPATLASASRLYAALPVTGGKVGAANLWRSAVDDTLGFAWDAFVGVRTTFPVEERLNAAQPRQGQASEEALVAVPLNVDRLRCAAAALCELLKFAHTRPVQIPMGQLVQSCLALLKSTTEDRRDGHLDATRRAMEESVVPDLWGFGCSILDSLASSTRQHLAPHIPRIVTVIVYHLEQPLPAAHRLPFLRALATLLTSSRPLHHPILPSRATKALLRPLTALLPSQSAVQTQSTSTTTSAGAGAGAGSKSKRARKRARAYEGDEVFDIANAVMCPTAADGAVVLQSLEALRPLLRNPFLSAPARSVAARLLLSIHLALPLLTPAQVAPDAALHGRLAGAVQRVCLEAAAGTTSVLGKSLGLVIGEMHGAGGHHVLDLLLHPRVPPLVRSLPHVDALSLFRAEEGDEEQDVRAGLGIGVAGFLGAAGDEDEVPAPAVVPSIVGRAAEPAAALAAPFTLFAKPAVASTAAPAFTAPTASTAPVPTPAPAPILAPSTSSAKVPPPPSVPLPSSSKPTPSTAPQAHDDDDEEMPSIDMGSDSE